ncbi:MAG: hypothetical protein HFI91_11855 [Lachnospiraceae bacterium]|jgi:hypothetical protein|nr:hypothetical protein [Lachnospiraceae bacterium]
MSSRTKIVVLHLKELLYTGIFVVLGVLFIVLLVIMFLPDKKQETSDIVQENAYIPGIYTTSIQLGGSTVDIEVVVDENHINSLRLNTLDEAVTTMYPLIEPSFDELAQQIETNQSLEGITYSDDNRYTSMLLLNAISQSLEKAAANGTAGEAP